jgi:hypothetical protein
MDQTKQSRWPDAEKFARLFLEPDNNVQHLHFRGIVSKTITDSMHGLRSLSLGNIFSVSLTDLLQGIAACPYLERLRLDVLQADVLVQEFQPESLMRVALPQLSRLEFSTESQYVRALSQLVSFIEVPETCRCEMSTRPSQLQVIATLE